LFACLVRDLVSFRGFICMLCSLLTPFQRCSCMAEGYIGGIRTPFVLIIFLFAVTIGCLV
jgi:hypothetical protein